jgi:hypothetical protein
MAVSRAEDIGHEKERKRRTVELTSPRGSANFDLHKLHAKHASAARVQRIIWKCWQTRTPYNEVIYLESLRKKGSSLLKFAADYQS